MTQDVKIIGFINCYLFYFLVTVLTVKVNRRLLYCVDIRSTSRSIAPNRLTYLVFNDRKLKLQTLTQGSSAFVDGNYRGNKERSQEKKKRILMNL
jgi:hypothetical protein